MKKAIILTLVLTVSTQIFSQTRVVHPKDSTAAILAFDSTLKNATDSTPLITLKDYNEFYATIVRNLPTDMGLAIIDFWRQKFDAATRKYYAKQKEDKKK